MIPTREQIAECILSKSLAGEWLRAMRDEIDRLTAELAALKPSEDREAAIRTWEALAMAVEDDGDYHPIDVYRVTLGEIRAAVALMRSAGDGKALLRELLAWSDFAGVRAETILMKIKEMLAQPAPVEQPAAAVPDDTRELVERIAIAVDRNAELAAKLAELVSCFRVEGCDIDLRAKAIAAELRGGA